ncbi:hypothetical protein ACGF7U_30485 [Micromonospora sp. NPDC047670]|uniref:hypothetical protein n=1 Tax=Micromonospora sp. NPDC047670 TaxID=3364252 RepID=UPI003718425E
MTRPLGPALIPPIESIIGAIAALTLAAGYAVGAGLPPVRRSRRAAAAWLAGLTAGWLVLLGLTPDGVWLAFPLFLLHLHLLPVRWGILAVVVTTAAAVGGVTGHQEVVTPGAVLGPVLGAAVSVGTVLGYQALYRESEQRQRLIE